MAAPGLIYWPDASSYWLDQAQAIHDSRPAPTFARPPRPSSPNVTKDLFFSISIQAELQGME
jgi:hypothetical protein